MDGWAFRREQKEDPALADIPVVVLTGIEGDHDQDLGAAAAFHKPVSFPEVVDALRRLCDGVDSLTRRTTTAKTATRGFHRLPATITANMPRRHATSTMKPALCSSASSASSEHVDVLLPPCPQQRFGLARCWTIRADAPSRRRAALARAPVAPAG